MLNQDIRRTALYIFRNTPVQPVIITAINISLVLLLIEVAEHLINGQYVPVMLLRMLAIVMVDILADCFALRSWMLGKCRFEYITQPFASKKARKKFIPLSVAVTIMYILLAIPVIIFLLVLVLGVLATVTAAGFDFDKLFMLAPVYSLLASVAMTALTFAVYIFASGVEYSVAGMIKRGFVYLFKNLFGYIWFYLTLNFVPALILAVLKMMFSSTISIIILYIPVLAYMSIARAGYVYENILKVEFGKEGAQSFAI